MAVGILKEKKKNPQQIGLAKMIVPIIKMKTKKHILSKYEGSLKMLYHIYQTTREGRILYACFHTKEAAEIALETLKRREKQYPKWLRAIYTLEGVR